MRTFAQNLREIRAVLGMSQEELAKRSGLKASAISHFETGRREPSLANLRRIRNALGASYDALLKDQ